VAIGLAGQRTEEARRYDPSVVEDEVVTRLQEAREIAKSQVPNAAFVTIDHHHARSIRRMNRTLSDALWR
jgi:ubiquinone biosynthesis protein COQ9